MRRREFLVRASAVGAAATLGASALAQPTRLPVVALLVIGRSDGRPPPLVGNVTAALGEMGWNDGQNVRIEVHDARGAIDNLPPLVKELSRKGVDVIVARGGTVTLYAVPFAGRTPIIMSASGIDPVRAGWAASYARPGGNVTGLTTANDEVVGKQLDLLKAAAPALSHVGVLWTRANAATEPTAQRAQLVAGTLGLRASIAAVDSTDVESTIEQLRREGADGLFALADPAMDNLRDRIAAVALQHRLPTAGQFLFYVDAGFLIAYAADLLALHRQTALYVDRVLRGTPPGEIPIENPTKFILRLNGKTAKALGLDIPPSLLVRADEVIE